MLRGGKFLAEALLKGERWALSKAITLVESSNLKHQYEANELLDHVVKYKDKEKNSFRIGIAGPPGAGKSTFIEALGCMLTKQNYKVAVLAIDPSSCMTGGSILGDKTRMEKLTQSPNAYVRPSATRGTLGGIIDSTTDSVLLCESAGYNIIIVESVGIGQSEVAIDETSDILLLLLPPAGGDELQGIKKGIMEWVDVVVINKADGKLEEAANQSLSAQRKALQLIRPRVPWWKAKAVKCSALYEKNIEDVWDVVSEFKKLGEENDGLRLKRRKQSRIAMWRRLHTTIRDFTNNNVDVQSKAKELQSDIELGNMSTRKATSILLHTLSSAFVKEYNLEKAGNDINKTI